MIRDPMTSTTPDSHPHSMHRDRDGDRDVHGLRLALGSILSPKRMPSSRTTSGTASPAHFGPGLVHPYPVHHHGHGHTPYDPSHPDTPQEGHENENASQTHRDEGEKVAHSPLGASSEQKETRPALAMLQSHSSASLNSVEAREGSLQSTTSESDSKVPPIMTTTNVHSTSTSQALAEAKKKAKDENAKMKDGKQHDGTMAGYIATLQSKRAWDALVHGSMS